MNRDKAYRTAVMAALENLSIDLGDGPISVPVYDSKLETNDQLYVLVESQTAQADHNYALLMWRCTIELSIYHVQQNSATLDVVDMVSDEIENRLLVAPGVGNLAAQTGWQVDGMYLASSNSLKMSGYKSEAGTLVNKILQFSSQTIKL